MAAGMTVTQATKDADPMAHAMKFGDGDGATTFTLPNHHLGHFVRGAPSGVSHGDTQGDAIRNITARAIPTFGSASSAFLPVHGFEGAMTSVSDSSSSSGVSAGSPITISTGIVFNASWVVPTANENRPYTANLSIKIHRGWM